MEKCGRADQATYGYIIRRMRSACWIINATDAPSEYVINISFLRNSGYANGPRYYVIRILAILYYTSLLGSVTFKCKLLKYSRACYNEQFLSINSGCYNEHRCYMERGGILSADAARACA